MNGRQNGKSETAAKVAASQALALTRKRRMMAGASMMVTAYASYPQDHADLAARVKYDVASFPVAEGHPDYDKATVQRGVPAEAVNRVLEEVEAIEPEWPAELNLN